MREVKKFFKTIGKYFLILYLLGIHALAILFAFEKLVKPYLDAWHTEVAQVGDPTEQTPIPTILPIPSIEPPPTPAPVETNVNNQQM